MMELNDLLGDIDGIGGDAFVPSSAPETAAVDDEASMTLPDLGPDIAPPTRKCGSLDLIMDVELAVTVELGQARIPLKKLMDIQSGDNLPLDGRADIPLKIFVNDRLVGYGEALVVDGSLAVRVVDLLAAGTGG